MKNFLKPNRKKIILTVIIIIIISPLIMNFPKKFFEWGGGYIPMHGPDGTEIKEGGIYFDRFELNYLYLACNILTWLIIIYFFSCAIVSIWKKIKT